MNIVLIGATGFVGAAILREVLDRGHDVTALVRDAARLPAHERLGAGSADVYDQSSIARAVAKHDAVISAFSPGHAEPDLYRRHVQGARSIIDGVKRAGVERLLVVGGAGSLEVAPGVQLVDSPEFPAQWKQTALATREVLNLLRGEAALQWTFLSPPINLAPGERTGTYRVGDDSVLTDEAGESRISLQDYAVAMADELERSTHLRQRFTVAY